MAKPELARELDSPPPPSVFSHILAWAITWPLRAITPAAVAFAVIAPFMLDLTVQPAYALLWCYSLIEVAFLGYFLWALRRLQRRHKPPHFAPAERARIFSCVRSEPGAAGERPCAFLPHWFDYPAGTAAAAIAGAADGAIPDMSAIGRDDMSEWLAWAFFGKWTHELEPHHHDEIGTMVDSVEKDFAQGFSEGSTGARSIRLNLDAVPAQHRALIYYVAVGLMDVGAGAVLRGLGFCCFKEGPLQYWLRAAEPAPVTSKRGSGSRTGGDTASQADEPIIFVHGVGMGLATYLPLLVHMARGTPRSRAIVLLELPHVSMRLGAEDVPQMAAVVAAAARLMRRHALPPALWFGHSLGTFVCAAFVRAHPELVARLVLVDPVCFLLYENDIVRNFCYRLPTSPAQKIQHYHISMELYTRHYFHRHFWWWECVLFANELPAQCHVFVASVDGILNGQRVAAYLKGNGVQTSVFPGLGHAEWLFNPECERLVLKSL